MSSLKRGGNVHSATMSLDDPGLDTVPVDSNSDDHREARRPDQADSTVAADAGPLAPRPSPDELIALAEQEQADRRIRAALADNGETAVTPQPAVAPSPRSTSSGATELPQAGAAGWLGAT